MLRLENLGDCYADKCLIRFWTVIGEFGIVGKYGKEYIFYF